MDLITQDDSIHLDSFNVSSEVPAVAEISLLSGTNLTYTLLYSTDLDTWYEGEQKAGTGTNLTLQHTLSGEDKLFFKVQIQPTPAP